MDSTRTYMDLDVWKNSVTLVKEIYELTKVFPKEEHFGLVSQLRRASVTIPSNIAEGCGRKSLKDSMRFFYIARGGLYEVETQIIISAELGFISDEHREKVLDQLIVCKKLINGFINYYQKLTKVKNDVEDTFTEYGNHN